MDRSMRHGEWDMGRGAWRMAIGSLAAAVAYVNRTYANAQQPLSQSDINGPCWGIVENLQNPFKVPYKSVTCYMASRELSL